MQKINNNEQKESKTRKQSSRAEDQTQPGKIMNQEKDDADEEEDVEKKRLGYSHDV